MLRACCTHGTIGNESAQIAALEERGPELLVQRTELVDQVIVSGGELVEVELLVFIRVVLFHHRLGNLD